jgi:putative transposase
MASRVQLLDRQRFPTQAEARMAIFEFLEGWYNPHRRNSALGCLSRRVRAAVAAGRQDDPGCR